MISLRKPRHWVVILFLGLMRLTALLPLKVQFWIGRHFGKILYRFRRQRRAIAERNIKVCFPELDSRQQSRVVRKNFESLGMSLVEVAMAWWCSDKKLRSLAHVEGLENLNEARARGKGVILLSAHFMTSEIAGHLLSRYVSPLHVVYKPIKSRVVDELLRRGRERCVEKVIPNNKVRAMLRSLKQGCILYYASDHRRSGKLTALVSFFSVPTVSSIATSKIARISGAPVVPFFPLRLPDCSGYRLILLPALEDFPSGDPVADTQKFYRLLEQHIRRDPSQYYWLQPLVWGRPVGFPNTYEESTTLALLSTRVGLR